MTHKNDFRKDELLEVLWHLDECHELSLAALREHDDAGNFEKDLEEFTENGILLLEGKNIRLTEKGRLHASEIVRRHRLAERLLVDVLGKRPEETEEAACEFEHILAPELVESICILLGHPKSCPHGSPIPEGNCCREARSEIACLVTTVDQLKPGDSARVASINTHDPARMTKLLSLGLAPGVTIRLLQNSPALIIEVNQTQIAIEETVGAQINVWAQTFRLDR